MCGCAVVSFCTGAFRSYHRLLALRVVVGFVYAPLSPESPDQAR